MVDARDGKNSIDVPKVFVDEVRELLGDTVESNELVDGRIFSDQRLAKHLVAIVQDWNITPPVLGSYTLTPMALLSDAATINKIRPWILEATVGRALKFDAIRMVRNRLQYQAGSVSADPNQNAAELRQMGIELLAEWAQRTQALKVQLNIDQAWSVAHSDLLVREIYEHGGIISVVGFSL